jgi:hypothetical protein
MNAIAPFSDTGADEDLDRLADRIAETAAMLDAGMAGDASSLICAVSIARAAGRARAPFRALTG